MNDSRPSAPRAGWETAVQSRWGCRIALTAMHPAGSIEP